MDGWQLQGYSPITLISSSYMTEHPSVPLFRVDVIALSQWGARISNRQNRAVLPPITTTVNILSHWPFCNNLSFAEFFYCFELFIWLGVFPFLLGCLQELASCLILCILFLSGFCNCLIHCSYPSTFWYFPKTLFSFFNKPLVTLWL